MNLSELRSYILLIAGRMVKWSTVSGLTQNFGGLNATMPPADPSLGEKSTTQTCRNMIGFGFRSAPVAGSECIVTAPRGGAVNAAVVASDHLGYGPTDLADGDAVVYSKAHHEGEDCYIKAAANGRITIRSKGGAVVVLDENGQITIDANNSQDVIVNGGSLKVARDTDPVNLGTWDITTAVVLGTPVVTAITCVQPDGAVKPLTKFGVPLTGKIAGGAEYFKG